MSGDHTIPTPSGGLETNSEGPSVLVTALLEAETKERFAEILEACGKAALEVLIELHGWMRLHDLIETASKITREQVEAAINEIPAHPATQWTFDMFVNLFSNVPPG